MKSVEDLTKELDDITKESLDKARELSDILKKYDKIDLGETTEEDKKIIQDFYVSTNVRRQIILKQLLTEWGGLLFI